MIIFSDPFRRIATAIGLKRSKNLIQNHFPSLRLLFSESLPGIVVEEADECCFWLELIIGAELLPKDKVESLLQEANELTAIFVSSIKTTKSNHNSTITNQK